MDTLQESGWEELRKEARKIEGDLDVKLSSYAKLGARFTQGGYMDASSPTVASSRSWKSMEMEIQSSLEKLLDINDSMSRCAASAAPTTVTQKLARHRDILHEFTQEFRRIKGNIISMKEHAELLSSVRDDISEYKASGGGSPRMQLLRERAAIHGSISHVLEKLPKSSVRKRLFNDVLERPIWNPAGVEQVRVVKEALHVSTAPESAVCRENEQSMILDFCKKCVKQEKAGSMYICGCPGTGKSLSIEIIKKILVNWANEEEIQPPDILSMNCMIFAQTTEVFSKILRKHFPQKEPNCSKLPLQLLHNLYSEKQTPDVKMILVIVDELDYLITKDRTVLHDLFMLTTMPFSRCILLGIANAIDLADRFMPKLRCLNCKPVVTTFRAYSKDQIIMILKDRLETLPYTVFEPQAVELCAGRVAAASGDMRKALSVCRSAIGMLEAEIRDSISNKSLSSTRKNDDQLKSADLDWLTSRGNNLVRIDHVAAALSKTFKSPVVDTIQSLPQHQQIILCSVVKLFRAAKKDTTVGELNKCYRDVCKSTSVPPVSIMELSSMCRVLDDQGIIKLGQSREDKLRRVALKVDSTEIAFALQGVRFFRDCLQ